MDNNPQQAIAEAAKILVKAKQDIAAILNEKDHNLLQITTNSGLDSIINRFNFLTGTSADPTKSTAEQFPPVTEFMGEKLTLPKKITREDLSPREEEKARFIERVNNLENNIHTANVDDILNSHTIPEDQNVLRGLAKRAGVKDFEDAEINNVFIDSIRKGLAGKAATKVSQDKVDKQLAEPIALASEKAGLNATLETETTWNPVEGFKEDPSKTGKKGNKIK